MMPNLAVAARKLGVFLGTFFFVALLSMCLPLPESAAEDLTKAALDDRPDSPERVAENYIRAIIEGRFEDAFLKYGSMESLAEEPAEDGKAIAQSFLKCVFHQCPREEIVGHMERGGVPEEQLLKLRNGDWSEFDEDMLKLKEFLQEISSEFQKKGEINSISTTLVSQAEKNARVKVEVKFKSGETYLETLTLVKEKLGEWKIRAFW